jgi:peptidoglycan hydrolase-like protein with peptidoglycan-binding domain
MALFDTIFPPYQPFGSRTLSSGLSGTDVAILQAVYNLMTSIIGSTLGAPISLNGDFDVATQQAVEGIQAYFGLTADGLVGPQTFFAFGQGVGANTTYGGPVYGSRELSLGMAGGDVTILQNRLNGFRYAAILGHPANGTFDQATRSAVLAFKQDAANNGDAGFPNNAIAGYGFFDASWLYTLTGGRALFSGRNGFDVVFLQALLEKIGYQPGSHTGFYDAATMRAVEAFQTDQKIVVDGVVGPVTFYRLGLSNAVAAPSPMGVAWPEASPPVSLSECAVLLSPTTNAPTSYGLGGVVETATGVFSIDVIGNALPAPSTFGTSYTSYAFTVDNSSGAPLYSSAMIEVPTEAGSWAGHVDGTNLADLSGGQMIVTAQSENGMSGPAVLTGPTCQPVPPSACVNGLDNNLDMAPYAACLKASGYQFVGRYLGGPCYQGTVLTVAEAMTLSQAGLLLFSIYSGANSVAAFTCGVQTLGQGQTDGQATVTLAKNVQQPTATTIYLDLQGNQISPENDWLSYVEGWTEAVAAGGYLPGVYSSPSQLTIIEGQSWAGSALNYWVAHTYSTGIVVPAPCPSMELSFATLWQYVLSVTICGSTGADIDSAETTAGMWSLA